MKRLFLFLMVMISLGSFAQVKISDMPTYNGDPAGGWVPVVINNTNRKVDASKFAAGKVQDLEKSGDTLWVIKNGVRVYYFIIAGWGSASPLIITSQPTSQTAPEGAVVTFSVTATGGTAPYTYQWQKNGANISGATSQNYIFTTNSSSGGSYRAIVTDAASSSVTSTAATLTINNPITVYWGYYNTDPYAALVSGTDALTYQGNFNISNGANISVPFPAGANEKYWVVKVPSSQAAKPNWFNTNFNYGTIPDQVWQTSFVSGSWRYYVSRIPASLDPASPVILQN